MCMPFKQIIMHALQCQHNVDVRLLFCFDIDLDLKFMYNLDFLSRFSLMGATLCTASNNIYAISTNYHVYIAMPT